jgi:hypothetical protein
MIENDIAEERVDTTLSKYKRQASLKVVESAPEASEICLTDLWQNTLSTPALVSPSRL